MEAERAIADALRASRQTLAVLDHAIATGRSEDVADARAKALETYAALTDLLDSLGIPQAKPPAGGAESDAPLPEPFTLPSTQQIAIALEE